MRQTLISVKRSNYLRKAFQMNIQTSFMTFQKVQYSFFMNNIYKQQNLINQTDKIPIIPEDQILRTTIQSDPESREKEYYLNKLRIQQKQFFNDQSLCMNAYQYIKNLNRLKYYQEAVQLNSKYLSNQTIKQIYVVFNMIKYRIEDKDTFEKLVKQIEFALEKQKQTKVIHRMDQQDRNKRRFSWISIFLLGYFFFDYINPENLKELMVWTYKKIFNGDANQQKNEDPHENLPKSQDDGKKKMERLMNIFQGKSDIQEEKNISTRFSDVLGIDEFKEELEEIVDYLKNPKKYIDSGARLPRGLLLIGPPGTGKTLLARALAGEADCSFFYKSGAEFDEMFVGVGASRVRDLFKKAREKAPSIIFIDEIDSVGGSRKAADPSHSRDTINQILTEMDGFKQSENIIVIGATNFEKSLDPAIKRPGRFDKIIAIPLPDMKGREQVYQDSLIIYFKIFSYYLQKIKYENEIQAGYLARQTSGFSGADIQNMVNVAILNAIKLNRKIAKSDDFEFALDRISMGIGRKNLHVSEKDKLLTAYHEGGHALTSLLTHGAIPLHKVTILPRGGALGFTSMIPENDMLNYTRRGIIAMIDVAMGGRAAEELFVGHDEVTSGCTNYISYLKGCSSDLGRATQLAYMYVKQLGMDEKISLISVGDNIKTSERYDFIIDMEVKRMLEESYNRVKLLLHENEDKLKSLATELIIKETLSAVQVKQLLNIT